MADELVKKINFKGDELSFDPISHADTTDKYGTGNEDNYGHVKLSDDTEDTTSDIDSGIAATPKAVAESKQYATNMDNATSGTLAVTYGGTGINSNPSLQVNLASGSAASVFADSPRPGVTGVLPKANGGTGTSNFGISVSGTTLVITGV